MGPYAPPGNAQQCHGSSLEDTGIAQSDVQDWNELTDGFGAMALHGAEQEALLERVTQAMLSDGYSDVPSVFKPIIPSIAFSQTPPTRQAKATPKNQTVVSSNISWSFLGLSNPAGGESTKAAGRLEAQFHQAAEGKMPAWTAGINTTSSGNAQLDNWVGL